MKRMAIWLALLAISSLLTFHLPLGSQSAHLSCFAVVLPLIGLLMPGRFAWLIIGAVYLIRPLPLTAGVPTLLATISWQRRSWLLHRVFPLAAMALFIAMQPAAWAYTLYWLIPVFCSRGLVGRALQATFVQHAAGSLIWLFLMPTTSTYWLALIPAVAVERLLAVTLSVGCVGLLRQAKEGGLESCKMALDPSA